MDSWFSASAAAPPPPPPLLPAVLIEHPSVAFLIAYGLVFELTRRRAVASFGRVNDGGSPRWRNIQGMFTQVVSLPLLQLAAHLMPATAAAAQRAFAFVFAFYLLFDFVALQLASIMVLHHALCLAGHAYALLVAADAFGHYMSAVVLLELGSATSCAWWFHGLRRPRVLGALYGVGMTLSNVLACVALLQWSAAAADALPIVGRYVPVVVTFVLVYMRQKEALALLSKGRKAATTG